MITCAAEPTGLLLSTHAPNAAIAELAEGLELGVQLTYLSILLVILSGAAYLVVRQVLVRRELDETAKVLGERVRTGEAVSEDYFNLGVVLARKRLFTQALKNYSKAVKLWDGEESELAQVYNAMGYCYLNMDKIAEATEQYQEAVRLQPGYVTGWNNLGDILERQGKYRDALKAYEEVLEMEPTEETAKTRAEQLKLRVNRISTTM